MTEPRRLLHGGDEALSALLGSARDDGPTEDDRRAVAAAIGLSALATAVTTSGATSGAIATKATGAKLSALALAKTGLGVALVFSLGLASGVGWERARSKANVAPSKPPSTELASPANLARPIAPIPPAAPVTEPSAVASVESAPSATIAKPPTIAPSPTTTAPIAAAPAASTLARETELVERARKSIAAHAYADALAALDAYDVFAPAGVLVQEARALRVQALAEQGKRLRALELGRAFLADFPASPYAKRVRAIVDALDANP